jgi:hypothetical protein
MVATKSNLEPEGNSSPDEGGSGNGRRQTGTGAVMGYAHNGDIGNWPLGTTTNIRNNSGDAWFPCTKKTRRSPLRCHPTEPAEVCPAG